VSEPKTAIKRPDELTDAGIESGIRDILGHRVFERLRE